MKINFNVTGMERKSLVGAVSQELNISAKYLGAPSFAYEVGGYAISKTGELTGLDNHGLVEILEAMNFVPVTAEYETEALQAATTEYETEAPQAVTAEYETEVPQAVTAEYETEVPQSVTAEYGVEAPQANDSGQEEREPAGSYSDEERMTTENAEQMVDAPETDTEPNTVPDTLIVEIPLTGFTPDKLNNLAKLVNAKAPLLKAALCADELPIQQTNDTLRFPWFYGAIDAEHAAAYSTLVSLLCKTAKTKKRVTSKERGIDGSPKYAMRCFLLSIGMIGTEYKVSRRILLSRLEGNSSWKNIKMADEAAEPAVSADAKERNADHDREDS